MVLQILADARQIVHDFDAMAAQQAGRADAGELQQLRTLQRARGQHHLPRGAHFMRGAVLAITQAYGPAAVENETGRLGVGFDAQVLAAARRPEIGHRRAVAPAVAGEQLEVPDAFLVAAVEIGGAGNAELLGTANDGLHQLAFVLDVRRP